MRHMIISFLFCVALGLGGLGAAVWLVATGQATASVDNLFLTLVGLMFAVISLGYATWLVRSLLARPDTVKERKPRERRQTAARRATQVEPARG